MSDCLFCAIGARDIPANFVVDDEDVFAIRDINPQAPTHVLVIPRVHVASVRELAPEHDVLWCRVLRVAQHVAQSEGISESGYRLVVNTGEDGGQTVSHLHMHVLGGRAMSWPPG